MQRYFEINRSGYNVRCKLYYNKSVPMKKAVIYCHGFAGHKDNRSAEKFADRLLSKYKGVFLVTFDFPCHGDDVRKKLFLADCETYLDLVISYVKEEYSPETIYAYATSFGGYLTLKYLSDRGNPFCKIALRCPAVNMYEHFTKTVMSAEAFEQICRGKGAMVGFDRKIKVELPFLEDLKNADICQRTFFDYADDILIIHGTKDEIVPLETVKQFAEDNVIEFVEVDGADHRFQNPDCMEQATKAVLAFFDL